MAGVSSCDGRTEKQPAAGSVQRLCQLCSIKWFNARQKEAQPGSAGGERGRERASQRASLCSHYRGCAAEHTHQHAPFPSLCFSLSLSHTHAHTLSHIDTGTQECRGSAVCSSTEQRSLFRMPCVFLKSELVALHLILSSHRQSCQ